jgi:multiple sugar transport system substrate-binding protein
MMRRKEFVTKAMSALAAFTLLAAACGSGDDDDDAGAPAEEEGGDPGEVVFFSSQFAPVEEADSIRTQVLADFAGEAEFITAGTEAEFVDRVNSEAQAGSGDVSLLGALHGTFVDFQADDLLMDLSDVADDLADAGIPEDLLELGRLGTDQQYYIPWVQASYVLAVNNEALEYLPDGADVESLTYEEYLEWAQNTADESGAPRFGFPAGEEGLMHRFLQGYLVPAFTGGVVTTFDDPSPWEYLAELWPSVHPQSLTYEFMQDPLLNGEVLVAWDHVARLRTALDGRPDQFTVVPAPAGPEGRAHMPVVAGLAVPNTAPNPEGAMELIRHLLDPAVQAATMASVGFFPVVETDEAEELTPGIELEADAVEQQANAEDALLVLLPIGLGDQGGAFNDIYRNAFERVVLNGEEATTAVTQEAQSLNQLMQTTGAPCWAPDPPSDGPCPVGGG